MTDVAESLSFPIGRHQAKERYSPEERTALITRLAAQPSALAAAISGLGDHQLGQPYRPGGWTVRQLVHHVADSHLNMYLRVKFALTESEPTIMPYDQDVWASLGDVQQVAPMVSIALLAALHERIVALFRSMDPAQFGRALMHPENGRMTVEQVLAMYAWHGDHHAAHIVAMRTRMSEA